METVVGIHRNHFGEIISFVTSGGRVISYQKALMEAANGDITGVLAAEDHHGNLVLSPEQQDQSFDHYPNLF
ncbi:DUF3892 domain-containing protein [Neobacillus niacini]|uniref:DUF3892 domain-containing protein n=1 Tax=Neobacillus niacini TaxID=86668 RepID=UPI00052F78E4|nr:DUF3892 domain-containing protein [Neobacillus niacini]KGM45884.1 hypothetical protein NP83_03420 [Neobacillus niacini]MEC1521411.1 DUF3892 domain-containing protein [Neobacillus niacini]